MNIRRSDNKRGVGVGVRVVALDAPGCVRSPLRSLARHAGVINTADPNFSSLLIHAARSCCLLIISVALRPRRRLQSE